MVDPTQGEKDLDGRPQTAKHLAARAIVALRAEFRVERIALNHAGTLVSGVTCNWEQAREAYADDNKLIQHGFAFVYVGTIIDQRATGVISEELGKEVDADMVNALEVRETAVRWGVVATIKDTGPFARAGYKLALRLIRFDESLIDKLAMELLEKKTVDEPWILAWFKDNAVPVSLDEMERSIAF